MDLRELPVPRYGHPYWGCERLLNFCLDVRTHCGVRNFLWVDSPSFRSSGEETGHAALPYGGDRAG